MHTKMTYPFPKFNMSSHLTVVADGEFNEESGDEALYNMSQAADIAWTVVFSVMIICAIVGNLAVFWIVLGK